MKKELNKQFLSKSISLCQFKVHLIMVLLCLLFFHEGQSQEKIPTVTLSVKQKSIIEIFKLIEQQIPYKFVYHDADLEKLGKKDMVWLKVPYTKAIEECLKGSNLGFFVLTDKILIKRKTENALNAAQTKFQKISGKVEDEMGVPIPGATIKVKGTTIGRISDKDGKFSILLPPRHEHFLEISFIGYRTQTVKIDTNENIPTVVLKEEATEIDEVVITGYQRIDKKLSAASTYTVRMDDIMEAGRTSIDQMLQGEIPGLMVMNHSGSTSSMPKIRMRGTSTLMGSASPVWVVDGVIREDAIRLPNEDVMSAIDQTLPKDYMESSNYQDYTMLGNAISGVNPMDIESITFLKDAAATAIYGTRAANGVIVVTTKKGKAGKMQVSYSGNIDFKQRPSYKRSLNVMNSQERMRFAKESFEDGTLFSSEPLFGYEKKMIDYMKGEGTFEDVQKEYAKREVLNTDWFDILFRNSISQTHSISISGGSDQSTFYFSASLTDDQGTAKKDNTKRYTVTSRINAKLFAWLTSDMKVGFSSREVDNYNGQNPMSYATQTTRALDANERYIRTAGKRMTGTLNDNTVTLTNDLTYNLLEDIQHSSQKSSSKSFDASVNLNAKLIKGLKAEGMFAYSETWGYKKSYAGEKSWYMADKRGYDYGTYAMGSNESKFSVYPYGGYLSYSSPTSSKWEVRAALDYNTVLMEDHSISLMVGMQLSSMKRGGFNSTEYGYFPDRGNNISYEYDQSNAGSIATSYGKSTTKHSAKVPSSIENNRKTYGSLVYGYKGRYVLNSSFSFNSSNRFGENKKFRTQPVWSASARWNVADENWMKEQNIFSQLSVKASYGSQGNVVSSISPDLIARYASNPIDLIAGEYALNISSLPNPELDWERTHTLNLGFEAGILKNRLTFLVEYYRKKTKDAFFALTVPMEYGEEKLNVNEADVENDGWELSLQATPVAIPNLRWNVSANISKSNNNVVRKMKSDSYRYYITGSVTRSDYAVSSFWSYKYAELDERGIPRFDFGDYGQYTEEQIKNSADLVLDHSGTSNPKLTGGFSTSLNVYKFTISANFSFSLGNHIRLRPLFGSNLKPQVESNYDRALLNRWRNPGDEINTKIPGLPSATANNTYYGSYFKDAPKLFANENYYSMWDNSDFRVVSGNYIRCQGINIGYSLPKKVIAQMGINGLSFKISAKDLFVIASKKLHKQDPETSPTAIPKMASYNFSVNLSF